MNIFMLFVKREDEDVSYSAQTLDVFSCVEIFFLRMWYFSVTETQMRVK